MLDDDVMKALFAAVPGTPDPVGVDAGAAETKGAKRSRRGLRARVYGYAKFPKTGNEQ